MKPKIKSKIRPNTELKTKPNSNPKQKAKPISKQNRKSNPNLNLNPNSNPKLNSNPKPKLNPNPKLNSNPKLNPNPKMKITPKNKSKKIIEEKQKSETKTKRGKINITGKIKVKKLINESKEGITIQIKQKDVIGEANLEYYLTPTFKSRLEHRFNIKIQNNYSYLTSINIFLPNLRGRGLGKRILAELIKKVKKIKTRKGIYVIAKTPNSKEFFSKNGFKYKKTLIMGNRALILMELTF